MAKPRVFISSTYYDLKHIRKGIQVFISNLGYEAIMFENGDIPFLHNEPIDKSCYKEVELSQIFVLIIGGRYGSISSDEKDKLSTKELNKRYKHYNSITRTEYETAKNKDIPIYIFIEKGVAGEYETYKKNKDKDLDYAHVDSPQIFELIEDIYGQHRNNLCKEFENTDDITNWLRDQWAGLFATYLQNQREQKSIKSLESQISILNATIQGLKTYSESLIRSSQPEQSEDLIKSTNELIRSKNVEVGLKNSMLFSHLLETHNYEYEPLIKTIIESKNLDDFARKLKRNMPDGESCGMVDYLEDFEIDDINSVRERVFGLEPFEKRKPTKNKRH